MKALGRDILRRRGEGQLSCRPDTAFGDRGLGAAVWGVLGHEGVTVRTLLVGTTPWHAYVSNYTQKDFLLTFSLLGEPNICIAICVNVL